MTLLVFLSGPTLFAAPPAVKAWEDTITIPTYLLGAPDPNPQFYFGGSSQGAQQRIYPYPVYDNLTTEKANKEYKIVYLENEYMKIGILPEIGGKVFEAIDKTNGYEFIYHQHVIKPALISLLGAWISGGIEWDLPHHHRATSFLPVQYKIDESADGSKTVWVGELELRDRMRWAVKLTLHPGKSYLEASFRMVNRTPLPTSMLCFSNVAVSVNDTYQIIYPPRTQFVTFHTKNSFTTWPVATTRFAGTDFSSGVDVSWYKNHAQGTSMFAWNYEDDFFAGYDHGKNAGIMSIADHNFAPGKKFFTWGNSPAGHAEDTLLTDSDGPYIELMVGAYSDNQPDYSWLAPNETRAWTQYWYPFRDIDGVKNANREAAVNLEVKDGKIHLGFYSTSLRPNAEITVQLKNQVLLREHVTIGPAEPWTREIAMPGGADEHDLRAILSVDGTELISYSPVRLPKLPMPTAVESPYPPPSQIATTEGLYFTGLRAEQFHSPKADPEAYWKEALHRDPGDSRVNTAMGIDCLRAGRFAEAEKYLRKALERAAANYTTPKEEEAYYYLGLALKAEGKQKEAFSQFAKSTWSAAWRGPGYLEMARLAAMRGDNEEALGYLDSALHSNTENVQALALRSALLRRTGNIEQACTVIAQLKTVDPLDMSGMSEQWFASKSTADAKLFSEALSTFPNNALEVAAEYMNAGLWQDGTDVLKLLVDTTADKSKVSPLAYYYLGYFADELNRADTAQTYYQLAAKAPTDYVFPFQMELIPVLERAMTRNPSDARAPYYLGNLLFDWQPERATVLWEKSASLGADFPVVYRNLAMVYQRQGNQRDKEIAALENAVRFGANAMVISELDEIYERNGVAPEKRLALMEAHQPVINRDEVIARETNLDIFVGKTDAAIQLLQSRFFRAWEGGGRFSLGDAWINAHLVRGQQHMANGKYAAALADFESAMQIPSNLREALGTRDLGAPIEIAESRKAELFYSIGSAYHAMGNSEKAQQFWRKSSEVSINQKTESGADDVTGQFGGHAALGGLASGAHVPQASAYYQALALEQLGDTGPAKELFQKLITEGTQALDHVHGKPGSGTNTVPVAYQAQVADAHYLVGLGRLGLNDLNQAKTEFSAALQACPDHFAAHLALAQLSLRQP